MFWWFGVQRKRSHLCLFLPHCPHCRTYRFASAFARTRGKNKLLGVTPEELEEADIRARGLEGELNGLGDDG